MLYYIRVTVDLIFVDENNKPIDGTTSAMALQDKDTQEALANSGINVAKVVVPEPLELEEASNSGCKCSKVWIRMCVYI